MIRRLSMVTVLIALIAALGAGRSLADGVQAEIVFAPASDEPVWVGEKLELHLELWSNALSFSDQWFVLPEVQGAFLLQAESSALKLSEKRNGNDWQGLRYSFQLYPQRAGKLSVPSFGVRFAAREAYGTPEQHFEFVTPVLSVEARLPPGANATGLVVSSTDFSMQAEWDPFLEDGAVVGLKVGDALTLEIRREAADVPGMVFTPLKFAEQKGLGIYPGNPRVEDKVARGDLVGRRLDSVTFVCELAGVYQLPEIRFQWWNPQRETLSEQVVPAVEIRVADNPAFATAPVVADGGPVAALRWVIIAIIVAIPAYWLTRRYGPHLLNACHGVLEERRKSEPWVFRWALKACASGDASAAYNAINEWLVHPAMKPSGAAGSALTLSRLARECHDAELEKEARALQQALVSGTTATGGSWQGKKMAAALKRLRSQGKDQEGEAAALSRMNPR